MTVLMITIGYPPSQVGGTEVYVFGLVEALKDSGHQCSITYVEPFVRENGEKIKITKEARDGTDVWIIQVNTAVYRLETTMFDAELRRALLQAFRTVVREVSPDVIHVHPLQLGIESYLIEDLSCAGKKVVMTFHSSTTTCARGDLIYLGKEVCDGLVLQERCTKCFLQWKGLSVPAAATLAKVPLSWYASAFDRLEGKSSLKKLRSLVSVPLTINERRKAWSRTTVNASAIVAVCDWVRETILKNGVSATKVVSSRHGLRLSAEGNAQARCGISRFGYLGRISPEKGIQTLLTALERMPPEVQYEFEFCSSSFAKRSRRIEEEQLIHAIHRLQRRDARVRVLDNVLDGQLRGVLGQWDALVVPSLWLESGPQVIYESFAVQTPVIGSRLGGIAELVREGETGFLFTPGKLEELKALLKSCANNPEALRALRQNISPARTTADVAKEMVEMYRRVLNRQHAIEKRNVPVGALG